MLCDLLVCFFSSIYQVKYSRVICYIHTYILHQIFISWFIFAKMVLNFVLMLWEKNLCFNID